VSAVNVRMVVVNTEAAHRSVGGFVIEMRGADLRDLAPRGQIFRSDVAPFFAAIASQPDEAVVGASPKRVDALERRSKSVDDTALLFGAFGDEVAYAGWNSRIFASEIGTDGLPGISAVGSLEQHVAGEIESVGVERREHQRLGAVGAVFRAAKRNGRYVLHLAGRPVKL